MIGRFVPWLKTFLGVTPFLLWWKLFRAIMLKDWPWTLSIKRTRDFCASLPFLMAKITRFHLFCFLSKTKKTVLNRGDYQWNTKTEWGSFRMKSYNTLLNIEIAHKHKTSSYCQVFQNLQHVYMFSLRQIYKGIRFYCKSKDKRPLSTYNRTDKITASLHIWSCW